MEPKSEIESLEAKLAAIRERRAKITPAPWAYLVHEPFSGQIRSCGKDVDDPTAFSLIAETPEGDERDNDMEFIAHAPEDIDTLLTIVDELRGDRQRDFDQLARDFAPELEGT